MKELIEFLNRDRAERGLNQSQYANLIGIDKGTYSRVINGQERPSDTFKQRLLENLKDKQLVVAYLICKGGR